MNDCKTSHEIKQKHYPKKPSHQMPIHAPSLEATQAAAATSQQVLSIAYQDMSEHDIIQNCHRSRGGDFQLDVQAKLSILDLFRIGFDVFGPA